MKNFLSFSLMLSHKLKGKEVFISSIFYVRRRYKKDTACHVTLLLIKVLRVQTIPWHFLVLLEQILFYIYTLSKIY